MQFYISRVISLTIQHTRQFIIFTLIFKLITINNQNDD